MVIQMPLITYLQRNKKFTTARTFLTPFNGYVLMANVINKYRRLSFFSHHFNVSIGLCKTLLLQCFSIILHVLI